MRQIAATALAVALAVLTACTQRSLVNKPQLHVVPSPTTARLDSVATMFFDLNGAPGMGVVIVQGDRILYERAFGQADVEQKKPFTPQTPFYIASATKSFTGLAVAILAERGIMDLDAPVSRYLPALELRPPLSPDSISIRSLLSHTHGIGNAGPLTVRLAYTGDLLTEADRRRALARHAAAPDGRSYAYGNIGYNVAAMAMERVTGQRWQQVLERQVLTPAGMTQTSPFVSKFDPARLAQPYLTTPSGFARLRYAKSDETMQSAGGLLTTLDDMALWLEAHLNDGRIRGRQVFSASALRETHRNQVTTPIRSRQFLPQVGYGFGWQLSLLGGDTLLYHGGGFPGFATHVSMLPSAKTGIVIFANEGDLGTPQVEILATALYDVVRGKPVITADSLASIARLFEGRRGQIAADVQRRAARSQALPLERAAYTGAFTHPDWGTIRVGLRGDTIEFRMGVSRADAEVFDAAKNQLRVELLGSADVVTVIVENGRAVALEISGVRFPRTGD